MECAEQIDCRPTDRESLLQKLVQNDVMELAQLKSLTSTQLQSRPYNFPPEFAYSVVAAVKAAPPRLPRPRWRRRRGGGR